MHRFIIPLILFSILFSLTDSCLSEEKMIIRLDRPKIKKGLIEDIQNRESYRQFKDKGLNRNQISMILWAAGGRKVDAITQASRTAPSAGARYPLELFLLIGKDATEGIQAGLYHYLVKEHSLQPLFSGDKRKELASACLGQGYISEAPVSLILAVDYSRTTSRYGEDRGVRYVHMDVGHSCQNAYLMVTDLGLGTVEIGAFHDEEVKKVLGLDRNIQPLAVMPIGYIK